MTSEMQEKMIEQISLLSTPADIFFLNLEKNYDQVFFPGKFINKESILEDQKYNYIPSNRGIFHDLTIEKLSFIRKLFNYFFAKYNSNTFEIESYKDDKHQVFVFDNFVVRFYTCDFLIKQKYIFQTQNLHPNLESILEAKYCNEYNFGFIVSEKLLPIVIVSTDKLQLNPDIVNSSNLSQIKTNINSALNFLHSKGIRHRDARMDNIGFRNSDGNFVLFDFEGSVIESNPNLFAKDFAEFNQSLKFYRLQ